MRLHERIKNLREAKNFTQRELANKIQVSYSVMNRIESGERPVRDIELIAIAQAFEVTTDYLLGNADTPNVIDSDGKQYVIDDEAMEYLEEIHKRPEMKILFSVSKKASKQDIETAVTLIEALKQKADPQTKE